MHTNLPTIEFAEHLRCIRFPLRAIGNAPWEPTFDSPPKVISPIEVGIPKPPGEPAPQAMKAEGTPRREGSLVVELATGVAIVNGDRIEIPPTEFEVLAALAARPGEAISAGQLLKQLMPDDPVATDQDLRTRIWRLRRRIGDHDRQDRIVGTRPRFGYLIDLPSEAVKVVRLSSPDPSLGQEQVIVLDEETPVTEQAIDDPLEIPEAPEASGVQQVSKRSPASDGRIRKMSRVRVPRALAVALIAALLSLSWAVGYWVSRGRPAAPVSVVQPPADDSLDERDATSKRPPKTRAANPGKDRRPGRDRDSDSGQAAVAAGDPATEVEDDTSDGAAATEQSETRVVPKPDAVLYHLFNPQTAEHYVTTSQTVANERQGAGYKLSNEGRVFKRKARGTIAISIDGGVAYIYRDADSTPDDESVSPLYRLVSDSDFFYTTSSSLANQAQAEGWSRSTAGFVVK